MNLTGINLLEEAIELLVEICNAHHDRAIGDQEAIRQIKTVTKAMLNFFRKKIDLVDFADLLQGARFRVEYIKEEQ